MNTFGKPNHEVLGNKELSELMTVLGLELGKPPRGLTYGTIVIMTDQDVDGGSIRCQLVNFSIIGLNCLKRSVSRLLILPVTYCVVRRLAIISIISKN